MSKEENPFSMPTDEEIFALRDQERKKKQMEREKLQTMKVHEKSTWSTRMPMPRERDIASTVQPSSPSAGTQPVESRRREKENLTDFVAKKRDMFLVQMSIDIKREEIRKLEEKARKREEILKQSEKMLEADQQRFEQFLKQSDDNAVKAMKKAEQEKKAKEEKLQDIRRITQNITAVKSEIQKLEDQISECTAYRDFLLKLTPDERKREHVQKKIAQRQSEEEEERKRNQAAAKATAAQRRAKGASLAPAATTQGKRPSIAPGAVASGGPLRKSVSHADDEGLGAEDQQTARTDDSLRRDENSIYDDMEIHFRNPHELLAVFSKLEEESLFLIRNCQATEETLEELRAKKKEMDDRMAKEKESLNAQVAALRAAINEEESKVTGQAITNSNVGTGSQVDLLLQLNEKVTTVYTQAGFVSETKPGTLEMLTDIERKLEDLFSQVVALNDPEAVKAAEKEKEAERREQARMDMIERKKRDQEERTEKALARAREAPFKRVGKPLMFRSQPLRKKKEEVRTVTEADEDPDQLFTE